MICLFVQSAKSQPHVDGCNGRAVLILEKNYLENILCQSEKMSGKMYNVDFLGCLYYYGLYMKQRGDKW